MSLCKCGCGQTAKRGNVWINGHNSRTENPFLGRKHTNLSKSKNSLAHKGKTRSLVSRLKQGHSISGNKNHMYGKHTNANENNGRWKGDNVGYDALHEWIRKNKPRTKYDRCELCNVVRPLQAANISGRYMRDVNDYKWLCRRCHSRFDNIDTPERDPLSGRFIRR